MSRLQERWMCSRGHILGRQEGFYAITTGHHLCEHSLAIASTMSRSISSACWDELGRQALVRPSVFSFY
jgi:hypothetical protein